MDKGRPPLAVMVVAWAIPLLATWTAYRLWGIVGAALAFVVAFALVWLALIAGSIVYLKRKHRDGEALWPGGPPPSP